MWEMSVPFGQAHKKVSLNQGDSLNLHNLCCEIMEYSDENESAVCNLASIGLPRYIIKGENGNEFDYQKLGEMVKQIVKNLNNSLLA